MPSSTAGMIAATRLGHAAARVPESRDRDWRPEAETPPATPRDTAPERLAAPVPEPGTPERAGLRWMLAIFRLRRA